MFEPNPRHMNHLVWEDSFTAPAGSMRRARSVARAAVQDECSMSGTFVLSVKSVSLSRQAGRKPSTLEGAARHNLREIQAELGAYSHIDASRTHLNELLAGPGAAKDVVELAGALRLAAGIDASRLRRDYCQAVEVLISLPPDTAINTSAFFKRCVEWAGERFGVEAILSAVVHRDEAAPHAHILISPIVDGRARGSELIARKALAALRDSFEASVGRPFGLRLPPRRLTAAARGCAAAAILKKLEATNDSVLCSATWAAVRPLIEANPRPFMAVLGLKAGGTPARKKKTFLQIMIGTGRGPKFERDGQVADRPNATNLLRMHQAKPILCRVPCEEAGSLQPGHSQ